MCVKTTLLKREIDKKIYMEQLENFVIRNSKSMVCKLKISMNGLK